MNIFESFRQEIKSGQERRMAVINPVSSSIFEALRDAQELVRPVLYGAAQHIGKQIETHGISNAEIRDIAETDVAAELAVKDVREGRCQLLMKGDISTSGFMKPVLNRDFGLRQGMVLSHIALAQGDFNNGDPLFIADGGINLQLDIDVRRAVAENTVDYAAGVLGRKPVIAFAAVIEDVNPKMPETLEARDLAMEYADKGYTAEGPIAFDVIFSREAAAKKGITSSVSGGCDVVIMPNLTAANFMIKQLILFSGASVGGIIAGAKVPLVLLSRSDSAATKLNSILMALR